MTWVIVRNGQVLYRGSREEVLAAADRYGLLTSVGTELDDAGEPRRVQVCGRSWHDDGTELPARIAAGCYMVPERMLPARLKRRAA